MTTKNLALAALLTFSFIVQAEVYKCPDTNGKVTFQALPCAGGSTLEIRRSPTSPQGMRESERQYLERIKAEKEARNAAKIAERQRQEELEVERAKVAAAHRQARALEQQQIIVVK